MAKLFLSYAREDAAVAERLGRALERSGKHDVWWDRDLHGGASFGSEIEQQLRDCNVVLVIWSPAGVQSPWVRDEAAIGRDSGKLIPVSMGDVEPPIGFRQFHTIDIGRHARASSAAIEKIEKAIDHVAPADAAKEETARRDKPRSRGVSRGTIAAAAGAAAFLLLAAGGAYLWRNQPSALTIAIVPAGGQSPAAGEYANSIATDMASFLSAHGNSASVLDPADPGARNAGYRFSVAYSGEGSRADASLSMAAAGQQGIVWSQSWSVPDVSSVDLKKQMSFAASRAFLCALEARKGRPPLNESLLKLYIVACSGLHGGDLPPDQIEANFSRIVEQQPRFAPAWEDLALVRAFIAAGRTVKFADPSSPLQDPLHKAISEARRLAPNSGKVMLAEAISSGGDWRKRLELADRAIELEPNEAFLYGYRSLSLQEVGRMTDALADATKAVELDPLSSTAVVARVFALIYADRAALAKEEIDKAYRVWPNDPDILNVDFAYSLRYGDPRHAEQLVSKGVMDISDKSTLPTRKLLAARENPSPANVEEALAAWRAAMGSRLSEAGVSRYLLALGTFGKMAEAFQLVSDPRYRPFIDTQIMFRPEFERLRYDPRFMAVAAQFGLVRYWRSSGQWPDFCSDASLPYDCKTEAAKYG